MHEPDAPMNEGSVPDDTRAPEPRGEVPSRRRWRRLARRGGTAAVLLALAAAGAWYFARPPAVRVAALSGRALTPAVQGVGTVEARGVVQVAPKIAGRVVEIRVDQGDPVSARQILARLDDAQLRAEVDRAEAAVSAAEAQLGDLVAGARPEEIAEARANAARARAQLDDLVAGARRQEIEELRERVRSAEASRLLAERELGRARQLFGMELIAAQEVDRARQAHDVAAAAERAARQALDVAVEGTRPALVEAARRQWEATEARLELLLRGPRPQQVEAARAQRREARAALALAENRLEDAALRSPLDGHVVSREVEPGTTVNTGTPVLKLVDPRTAWVTVHVDERETGRIAVGDAAVIRLRSHPGRTLQGRVARLRRESDRVTEQLAVDVTFSEPPGRLTLGEQAEATLSPAPRLVAVALPLPALVRTADGPAALVVVDGRLRSRPVRIGIVDPAGWAEVLDGLRAGERVVLSPGRLADPGSEGRRVLVSGAGEDPARAGSRP